MRVGLHVVIFFLNLQGIIPGIVGDLNWGLVFLGLGNWGIRVEDWGKINIIELKVEITNL